MSVPAPSDHRRSPFGPALALVILAPVVAELLYGAVRLTTLFVLVPEFLTWGCGALLIREAAQRWGKGWGSVLLLGLALAVAEEWVVQQTSISPLVRAGRQAYGRVWGVNWVYFLWALGYESVWVAVIPVQLVELLYPSRRRGCWLRPIGLVRVAALFALGLFLAWYGWTQRARVAIFHMAPYSPPIAYVLAGVAAVAALVAAAYLLPSLKRPVALHGIPSAPIVGLAALALGAPWAAFSQLGWGRGAFPSLPFEPVLLVGMVWAALAYFLVERWTSSPRWSEAHRRAIVTGGVMACMAGGFVVFALGGAKPIDWGGKAVFDALACVGLAWLNRTAPPARPSASS